MTAVSTDIQTLEASALPALLARYHALQFAWSQACYKVLLSTGRKDEATLQFYEHAGFDRNAKQAFMAKPPSP